MSAAQWEAQFSTWAQAPSQSETDKIENALSAVRKAIANSSKLAPFTKVFVQGSYRNRVNVRLESDVDIGVVYTGNDLFGDEYPPGKGRTDFGNIDAPYPYAQYKNDVEAALRAHFGNAVNRGAKAFDIHENTYRVDSDVVPLVIHRRYLQNGSYICGTQLFPDQGWPIVNWPERLFENEHWPAQHYENGLGKNQATSRAYRATVRIIKKLRSQMEGDGYSTARAIKGFFVECLVWNAPNSCFVYSTWYEVVNAVLAHLDLCTADPMICNEWGEVSEFKYLFKNDDAKRTQARAFVINARKYIS